jgi:hypothetical protein
VTAVAGGDNAIAKAAMGTENRVTGITAYPVFP